MLKKIFEVVCENRYIYMFGCGERGKDYYSLLRNIFPDLRAVFLDNNVDVQKNGVLINGERIEVKAPKILNGGNIDGLVLLTSERYYREMALQLEKMGVPKNQIVLSEGCIMEEMTRYKDIIKKRRPQKKLNFVVDLAEQCNLNCQNCDHFSPLAKEHFTDIDQFEKDIKRIAEIMGDDILHVDLEGGEPLLNPDVCRYIEIVHKYMPNTGIKIFSNGLLLPKMNQMFWDKCREHGVVLEVTHYPVDFDYQEAESIAEKNGVVYHAYGGKSKKVSWHKPLDLSGRQDRYESFENCYLANGECTMLKNGKLFPCTLIPNIEIFNSFFNQNIVISNKDYIDLYSDVTKEEIFEFLCNPPMACRYCKVKEWTNGHKWRTTRRDIKEWT